MMSKRQARDTPGRALLHWDTRAQMDPKAGCRRWLLPMTLTMEAAICCRGRPRKDDATRARRRLSVVASGWQRERGSGRRGRVTKSRMRRRLSWQLDRDETGPRKERWQLARCTAAEGRSNANVGMSQLSMRRSCSPPTLLATANEATDKSSKPGASQACWLGLVASLSSLIDRRMKSQLVDLTRFPVDALSANSPLAAGEAAGGSPFLAGLALDRAARSLAE